MRWSKCPTCGRFMARTLYGWVCCRCYEKEIMDWKKANNKAVASFFINIILPMLKKGRVKIFYKENGEPYLFSTITEKEIPFEHIQYILKKLTKPTPPELCTA